MLSDSDTDKKPFLERTVLRLPLPETSAPGCFQSRLQHLLVRQLLGGVSVGNDAVAQALKTCAAAV